MHAVKDTVQSQSQEDPGGQLVLSLIYSESQILQVLHEHACVCCSFLLRLGEEKIIVQIRA